MIDALSYVVVCTPKFSEWLEFATSHAGFQVDELQPGNIARLRMDEKIQRFIIRNCKGEPSLIMGFNVPDGRSLSLVAKDLKQAGFNTTQGTSEELEVRGVREMIHFVDPDGHRVEVSCGHNDAISEFSPSRPIGGFRTGDLGMGHVALKTENYTQMCKLYREVLKFKLSDTASSPFQVEFLHCNARHHTLGLADAGMGAGVYHLMVEYNEFDDIGRAYDVALTDPASIGVTLGRHTNDHMTSFYVTTPDGWLLELGWGGRTIGDNWQIVELPGLSLWGHERAWLPPHLKLVAREQLKALSEQGVRAPIISLPQQEKEALR